MTNIIKYFCKKCGRELQSDKDKTNKNWLYFDLKNKCQCGGEFEMKMLDIAGFKYE